MRLPSVGHLPGMLRLCARIDARRPASWLALATAGWAAWWIGTSPAAAETRGCLALLSATLAAAAAIGDLPLELRPAAGLASGSDRAFRLGCQGAGRWVGTWASARGCWPLAGLLVGTLAAGAVLADRGGLGTSVLMGLAGLLLAVGTLAAGRLCGTTAADAASLAIVIAAASAAAGFVGGTWLVLPAPGCAVVIWLVLGSLAFAWGRTSTAAVAASLDPADTMARGPADVLHLDPLPAGGPLRRILVRLAMVAALVAMAGWFVLVGGDATGPGPVGHDGREAHSFEIGRVTVSWALLAAAWFVGLAVPQATLLDGVAGARGWERLWCTAAQSGPPGRRGPHRRRLSGWRLGRARLAAGVAFTQAAILGWPAMLGAMLSLPLPDRGWLPLAIAIGLLAAAGLLVAAVALAAAVHGSRETVCAVLLAIVVVAGNAILLSVPHVGRAFPVSRGLPSLAPSPCHGCSPADRGLSRWGES